MPFMSSIRGATSALGRGRARSREYITATGGTITTINVSGQNYTLHKFTGPGTFQVTALATESVDNAADVLLVAGGGGGGPGNESLGGGGGGGVVYSPGFTLTQSPYSVAVGSGGASQVSGGNTTFPGITTAIGGGNGGPANASGSPGGSGGGGAGSGPQPQVNIPGGTGTPGQGTNGGFGRHNGGVYWTGGGGGGSAQAGQPADHPSPGQTYTDAANDTSGDGGNGTQYPQFGPEGQKFFGSGGGGGACQHCLDKGGEGGGPNASYPGAGGNGQHSPSYPGLAQYAASAGQASTGSGGGGGGHGGGGGQSGSDGIVLIRYKSA